MRPGKGMGLGSYSYDQITGQTEAKTVTGEEETVPKKKDKGTFLAKPATEGSDVTPGAAVDGSWGNDAGGDN
jgi:hypothetical protein